MKNRLLSLQEELEVEVLAKPHAQAPSASARSYAKDKPLSGSQQITNDQYVIDVLHFFFNHETLTPAQLNQQLRELAAVMVWEATQASRRMDLIPRPTLRPTFAWLIMEAVKAAVRRALNEGIYNAVRVTVAARFRSEYELAKEGISGSLSLMKKLQAGSYSFGSSAVKSYQQTHESYALDITRNYSGALTLSLSDAGLRFIARHEGLRNGLYNDVAGHCTIGYGHLVHQGNCNGSEPEEFRSGISTERAMELLRSDLRVAETAVNGAVTVALTQNQFDSLVSFTFNVGAHNFRTSTLLRVLNEGNYAEVPNQLMRWVHAGGRRVQGLVNRRTEEGSLFRDGVYQSHAQAHNYALATTVTGTVPSGIITDPFYRNRTEKQQLTGRTSGREKHAGIDVSTSSASGGDASDSRRGLPVYAAIRTSIPVSELNQVKAINAAGNAQDGLQINGSGNAALQNALVLVQPWQGADDAYGGVLGLACRYQYTNNTGANAIFTLYIEFLHLITGQFLPKDGHGRIISAAEWAATGKGIGFGPRMTNNTTFAASDFDPLLLPLIGYLGATQFPHVHIQAAYSNGTHQYLRHIRFDPTVMIF